MKFKLETAGIFYTAEEKERLEKLGFSFEKNEPPSYLKETPWSKTDIDVFIEFKTLEELIVFIREWGSLVIDEEEIIIYDGYLE